MKKFYNFFSYLKYIDLLNLQIFGATSKFHNIIRPTFSEKKYKQEDILQFLSWFIFYF